VVIVIEENESFAQAIGNKLEAPYINALATEGVNFTRMRGVTHPTVWKVSARAEGNDVAGTATTAFTFKDVNLDQPKVPVVLSVADTIRLEYDFRFVREAAKQ
jgi:hypothetical protein